MECIKVPNTNAREIKIISDFDHLSMLEKLSADFFGILQDYSQDISDCKLTKDTLYRSLVEYCKEEEALPPPPPPTEDFSSNIVPMEDGEVSNTNALFPAGEIEFISDFDHQREKAEILSYLKLFGIELGCADKHESPAEVVTSDSIEWTREEDEKLLHLAKLMPSQWRTIATLVGRTSSQCVEHYESLTDSACEDYGPGDDPRNFRPGEIDPNPESKPARPDQVDMDEDEKEMLSEARARLVNTRGKKAKRKAREKQLEEARRLASLQKRREVKAAGFDNKHRKRKREGINYNDEVLFEKRPPPGFYDVADESFSAEQPKFPTSIEELEGERRSDKEARLRKQDVARNKIAQRLEGPSAILHANKLNNPETVTKRPKLNLPTPQVSDYELEHIAKFGLPALNEELSEGSGATRALLADYTQTPRLGMTPLRTPAGKLDPIMMEAENQARLRLSQTSLFGGVNPDLHPSNYSGVTPKKKDIQAPNDIVTPSVMSIAGPLGMAPRDGYSFVITPKGTSIRDELHINEEMEMHDTAKLKRARQADIRRNLNSSLAGLPQPKNEYLITVQHAPEDDKEPEEKMEEDMSARIAREKADEEFDEDELKEADQMIKEEANFLRAAMGNEDEDIDEFVKEHKTSLNDIMYCSTRDAYGLSSVAGNTEKVAALQKEVDIVNKRMDDDKKKAVCLEQKIKLHTDGYQMRAAKLRSQLETTIKQMTTAGTEYECLQALQRQEALAASTRINCISEDVQKQKELEKRLQNRYGDLLVRATVPEQVEEANQITESSEMINLTGQGDSVA